MFKFYSLFAAMVFAALMPVLAFAGHKENVKKCAEVCSLCQIDCDSCFVHCLQLITEGKAEHKATAQICADCAECCKACSTLCGRNSPLAKHMLECCAKCCDECASACEKFGKDEQMVACAKSCRDCARECLEMSKHDHK